MSRGVIVELDVLGWRQWPKVEEYATAHGITVGAAIRRLVSAGLPHVEEAPMLKTVAGVDLTRIPGGWAAPNPSVEFIAEMEPDNPMGWRVYVDDEEALGDCWGGETSGIFCTLELAVEEVQDRPEFNLLGVT